ncbi:MAG: pirin family protein [Candidatus Cryosericum sp.]
MITRIPAEERHFVNTSWMQAYWLFSYGEWYVPGNVRLGKLRVFNDDLVQPREGFGAHPHEELELVTIVLAGQLTIIDDAGGHAVVHADGIIALSTFSPAFTLDYAITADRCLLVYVTSGSISLQGSLLEEGDQGRVTREDRPLSLASATGGSFVLVDVAA